MEPAETPPATAALEARLDAARAALLAALEGLTERDFATDLGGGETLVRMLARVASEEIVATARMTGVPVEARVPEKPLPPQAVHELAGARYRARLALAALAPADAEALVATIEALEATAVERVRTRPAPPPPPPAIPVVRPQAP